MGRALHLNPGEPLSSLVSVSHSLVLLCPLRLWQQIPAHVCNYITDFGAEPKSVSVNISDLELIPPSKYVLPFFFNLRG